MVDAIRIDMTEAEVHNMGPEEKSAALVKLAFATYRILNGDDKECEGLCRQVTRHEGDLKTIWKFVWIVLIAIIGAGITAIWAGVKK